MASRYRIIRRIGSGGTAELHLARESREDGIERIVVLKRVLRHLRGEAEFVTMFATEARLAMQLQHPNIVQVLDCGVDGGVPFLVMEWLDGVDLRTLFRSARDRGERLDPAVACAIVAAAARGLHYAHTRADPDGRPLGIVHRDVSPHNVFVARDGGVKVLDFGIARSTARLSITRTGTVKGKPAYLAPEQIAGMAVDARTDLFALGTILWELLSGERLWGGHGEDAALLSIPQTPVRAPSACVSGLPPSLDPLVLSMLSKFPAGRPADALQVADRLDHVVHELGCRSPTSRIGRSVASLCPLADDAGDTQVSALESVPEISQTVSAATQRETPSRRVRGRSAWVMALLALLAVCAALGVLAFGERRAPGVAPARRDPLAAKVTAARVDPGPKAAAPVRPEAAPTEPGTPSPRKAPVRRHPRRRAAPERPPGTGLIQAYE